MSQRRATSDPLKPGDRYPLKEEEAMDRLKDRVIIVTGGAHGIGRAYCQGLAQEGARVVVADIDASAAEVVARTLSEGGHDALAVPTDVSNP